MKHTLIYMCSIVLLSACVTGVVTVDAQTIRIQRNLSLGDTGGDVYLLQQALNRVEPSPIALSGPGSPGNETSYFGSLTQQAVIVFQERYASEVLAPLGLSQGTGYVGPSTRAKINEVLAQPQRILGNETTSASTENERETLSHDLLEGNKGVDIYASDKRLTAFQKEVTDIISEANGDIEDEDLPSDSDIFPYFIRTFFRGAYSEGDVISLDVWNLRGGRTYTFHFGPDYYIDDVVLHNDRIQIALPALPSGTYDIAVSDSLDRVSNTRPLTVQ